MKRIGQDYANDDKARNESLTKAAYWTKTAATTVVYGGAGAAAAAAPGTPLYIPGLIGGGGPAILGPINEAIDSAFSRHEQDSTDRIIKEQGEFNQRGEENSARLVNEYVKDHFDDGERRKELNEVSDAYYRGRELVDTDNARGWKE